MKMEFPRLYLISTQKQALVSDMLGSDQQVGWNSRFRRNLFVWEEDLLREINQRLHEVVLDI